MNEGSAVVETELPQQSQREEPAERTIRAAVAGARGYAGRELITWLARHPRVRLTRLVTSGQNEIESVPLEAAHPGLRSVRGEDGSQLPSAIQPFEVVELTRDEADVVFLATAHEASARVVPKLLSRHLRVIDLSGAFRLKRPAEYSRWYGFEHPAPREVIEEAVYGLPELNRGSIARARLVANPGCYATAAILALAPLVRAGWIERSAGIVCDAKSGASGAGRTPSEKMHFTEVNENCRAYGLFNHRHVPEILQSLNLEEGEFMFTPHLVPVNRGILATVYTRLAPPSSGGSLKPGDIFELYRSFYAASPLVRVIAPPSVPEIQWVASTPYADLGFALDEASRRLIVVAALDNLVKGAAGQAIENMNLMFGLGQATGLV